MPPEFPLYGSGQAVKCHIQNLAVFHGVVFHQSLEGKSRLLQRPPGAGVVGEGLGIDTQDIGCIKDNPAELPDSLRHNAPAPVFLCQIVAQLCRLPMDVALPESSDAAHSPIIDGDGIGKGAFFIRGEHCADIVPGVLLGVGVGQSIPQIVQNLLVIQRRCQILCIRQPPFSQNSVHVYRS